MSQSPPFWFKNWISAVFIEKIDKRIWFVSIALLYQLNFLGVLIKIKTYSEPLLNLYFNSFRIYTEISDATKISCFSALRGAPQAFVFSASSLPTMLELNLVMICTRYYWPLWLTWISIIFQYRCFQKKFSFFLKKFLLRKNFLITPWNSVHFKTEHSIRGELLTSPTYRLSVTLGPHRLVTELFQVVVDLFRIELNYSTLPFRL